MTDLEFRKDLPEGALVFDNPSFDKSIVGVTHEDRVVYDYNKMIEEICEEENMTHEDAADFIEYNTIRSLLYMNSTSKPVVMYPMTIEGE